MEVLYGLHPVEEALKAGRRRFDHVLVARERDDPRMERLLAQCREAGVRVRQESREQLTLVAQTPAHQGVVAYVRPQESLSIEDLFERDPGTKAGAARLLLALDGVEDPQNLGALLRVADGAGVDGIVLTERRSAPMSPVAVKASAGASEHLRIARVVNLVRRTCDHLLRIPMAGGVNSLNVSAAGAVVLYEAFRQRRSAARISPSSDAASSKPGKQKGLGS